VFAPDGSLLRKVGGGAGHTPIIAADGSIYRSLGAVGAIQGDGTHRWTFQPKNSANPPPAIGFDGTIYAGTHDGSANHLHAFTEVTGNNGGYNAAPWPQERGDRANTGRARRRP
jgi:outer membrane protein assembly factor BamB